MKVRDWDYGVLLLSPSEARGTDTRFRKVAKVLIICQVQTYHELQQMVGRSSRARGVCEGQYFTITDERAPRVIEKLKHQSIASLQGLERLLLVLEKRTKDQALLKKLHELKSTNTYIKSYEQLKNHFSEQVLARLTKDIFD